MTKKPRKQKFPRRSYDGQSQFPDGMSHSPRIRQSNKSCVTDWTDLPDGLVDAISRCLPVRHAISMGLTCKPWRRVLTGKTHSSQILGAPWYMRINRDDSKTGECISIAENDRHRKLYFPIAWRRNCLGSIEDWLVVTQINSGLLEVFFYNPFSKTKLPPTPPTPTHHYYKIVVSASPADDENCVYVLLHKSLHDIACWTRGIPKWCTHHLPTLEDFDDAVFCNGCFYFITRDFNICTFDMKSMISAMKDCADPNRQVNFECRYHRVKKPDTPMTEMSGKSVKGSRSYLVESCGEVLLVLRLFVDTKYKNVMLTCAFRVFKLDTHCMIWKKMESLEGRALLLGNSDTRSFPVAKLGRNLGNSIFFHSDFIFPQEGDNEWTREKYRWEDPLRFGDWGVFMMDRNRFHPRLSRDCIWYPGTLTPVWITAPIWWYLGASNPQISATSL